MRQLYARIFTSILESSLAENWQARHVFEDMLKLADDGILDITREVLARRTIIPSEVIDRAIEVLEAPDPNSRDSAEDGRRIVRLDEHRDWGWRIVNWEKYEAIRCAEHVRELIRARRASGSTKQRVRTILARGWRPGLPVVWFYHRSKHGKRGVP
jgi:hypothetical protein